MIKVLQKISSLAFAVFLVSASFSAVSAQELLCDNEDGGTCVSWDFNDGATNFGAVDNPDASGINTSAKVLRFETDPGSNFPIFVHDFVLAGGAEHDFSQWPVYSVKVWTALTDGKVLWKFENGDASAFTERSVDAVGGAWEELIFDFTGDATAGMVKWVIFPDFGTRNRQGDWYFDDFQRWDALPTSNEKDVPLTFALEQNYPNPFNPSTQIRYTMQEPGTVSLAIYDVNGIEVQSIFTEDQAAGEHVALFNAEGLSSGMYVYRLTVNGVTTQRKMMLNK